MMELCNPLKTLTALFSTPSFFLISFWQHNVWILIQSLPFVTFISYIAG